MRGKYNRHVGRVLREAPESAAWERCTLSELERVQRENEGAVSRCIGLCVETRPDRIDVDELRCLRELGVTKVQLGVQSLSDDVLRQNRRGHDVATTRAALRLLRGAGFKLHVHWMANLLGSDPEADVADFQRLFEDRDVRPDELKVYPCSLLDTAELVVHHRSGNWQPYDGATLVDVLARCLATVPATCRVTRVIRDIPSTDILAGNLRTNLREDVEAELARRGVQLREIRSREIRAAAPERGRLSLRETRYGAGGGEECFLEWCDAEGRIAGFLRLHLPEEPAPYEELAGSAIIREVHVYGQTARLGARAPGQAQHVGLGSELIGRARELARAARFRRLAVISAVGTRGYYRRLGFRDGRLYQHAEL